MFRVPTAQPLSSRGAQPLFSIHMGPQGPEPRTHQPLACHRVTQLSRTRPETTVLSRTRGVRTWLKAGAGLELKPPLRHPWTGLKTGPPSGLRETRGVPQRTCP